MIKIKVVGVTKITKENKIFLVENVRKRISAKEGNTLVFMMDKRGGFSSKKVPE